MRQIGMKKWLDFRFKIEGALVKLQMLRRYLEVWECDFACMDIACLSSRPLKWTAGWWLVADNDTDKDESALFGYPVLKRKNCDVGNSQILNPNLCLMFWCKVFWIHILNININVICCYIESRMNPSMSLWETSKIKPSYNIFKLQTAPLPSAFPKIRTLAPPASTQPSMTSRILSIRPRWPP